MKRREFISGVSWLALLLGGAAPAPAQQAQVPGGCGPQVPTPVLGSALSPFLPSTIGSATLAFDFAPLWGAYTDSGGTVPANQGQGIYTLRDRISSLVLQQATSANQPVLSTDLNGVPVVQFLGSSPCSMSAATNALFRPGTGYYTVFLVLQLLSDDAFDNIVNFGNSASTLKGWNIFFDGATNLLVCRCNASGDATQRASQTLPVLTGLSVPILLEMQMTGSQLLALIDGSGTGWVNGGDGPAGNTYTGNINNTDSLFIGQAAAGTNPGSFNLYRFAAYQGDPTAPGLRQIRNQLMNYYALSGYSIEPETAAAISLSASTAVFTSATDFFRIPAIASDGTNTVVAIEHRFGSNSDSGHIEIDSITSSNSGTSFAAAIAAATNGSNCARNPVLIGDPTRGKIHLLFCTQTASATEASIIAGTDTCDVNYCFTSNGGSSWSSPVVITSQIKTASWRWMATGPGAGVCLSTGRLVCPMDHSDPAYTTGTYKSNVIYSDDGGTTWTASAPFSMQGSNETTVADMGSGNLLCNSRYTLAPFRVEAKSADSGATWGTQVLRTDQFGNATQGQLLNTSKRLLHSGIFSAARTNINVHASNNGGLFDSERSRIVSTTSAYSSMCVLPNGKIGLVWEQAGTVIIEFATFTAPTS